MVCEFKFKIEKVTYKDIVVGYKPLEQCPKPRTHEEYFLQKKLF